MRWRVLPPFDWREFGEFADRRTLMRSRPYHLPSLSITAFE
jgi:hypothetical protein